MWSRHWCVSLVALGWWATAAAAEEARISWYDPTCRFFVVDLAEGFGLYEWKQGSEPTVGDAIAGEIGGGPELEATLKSSGEKLSLVHWADGKTPELLIKHTPDWCKSRRKKK